MQLACQKIHSFILSLLFLLRPTYPRPVSCCQVGHADHVLWLTAVESTKDFCRALSILHKIHPTA